MTTATALPAWAWHLEGIPPMPSLGHALALYQVLKAHELEPVLALAEVAPQALVLVGKAVASGRGLIQMGWPAGFLPLDGDPDAVEAQVFAAAKRCRLSQARLSAEFERGLMLIGQAQQRAEEASRWSTLLSDPRAIGRYVESLDEEGEVDGRDVEERFEGSQAFLARVLTVDIVPGSAEANIRVPRKERAYRSMPAETVPPLLLEDDGCVADGNHRLRVALKRGDTWLWAYCNRSIDADLQLQLLVEQPGAPAEGDRDSGGRPLATP